MVRQMTGSCGLASLLMVLRPEKRNLVPILASIFAKIEHIFNQKSDQMRDKVWQYALQYLLFSTVSDTEFGKKLESLLIKGFEYDYTDFMKPMVEMRVFQAHPRYKSLSKKLRQDHEVIKNLRQKEMNREWIINQIKVFKIDVELKILAYLFGAKFIPNWDNPDGTGSFYITKSDKKQITTLYSHIIEEKPVLLCREDHWVAVSNVYNNSRSYKIEYKDPSTGDTVIKPLKEFSLKDRFYVFEFSIELLEKSTNILRF
ncbi:MAG: hypothetical protein GF364_07475 [Candidatus Lokiarchaeota archaeon]|nr:hypothetical protein [Candidatus Lokiarchaeota archaeon]